MDLKSKNFLKEFLFLVLGYSLILNAVSGTKRFYAILLISVIFGGWLSHVVYKFVKNVQLSTAKGIILAILISSAIFLASIFIMFILSGSTMNIAGFFEFLQNRSDDGYYTSFTSKGVKTGVEFYALELYRFWLFLMFLSIALISSFRSTFTDFFKFKNNKREGFWGILREAVWNPDLFFKHRLNTKSLQDAFGSSVIVFFVSVFINFLFFSGLYPFVLSLVGKWNGTIDWLLVVGSTQLNLLFIISLFISVFAVSLLMHLLARYFGKKVSYIVNLKMTAYVLAIVFAYTLFPVIGWVLALLISPFVFFSGFKLVYELSTKRTLVVLIIGFFILIDVWRALNIFLGIV